MKTINIIKILALFIHGFILIPFLAQGQDKRLPATEYSIENKFEEIFLITDREVYLSGESVWFLVSCRLNEVNAISNLSRVVYIELFDAEKKPLSREKYELSSGKAFGKIDVPEELPSGNYFLRAYTQLDRNFRPDYYFNTCITVINPEISLSKPKLHSEDSIVIIPEGMGFISNLPAKLAILFPPSIISRVKTCNVVDQEFKQTGEVKYYENGLGSITITPDDESRYFLRVNLTNGDSILVNFPEPLKEGISIQAEQSKTGLKLLIKSTNNFEYKTSTLRLTVISGKSDKKFETEFTFHQNELEINVPIKKIDEGINYFVVQDEDGKILQFISYFIFLDNTLNIPIHLANETVSPRGLIEGELLSPNGDFLDTAQISISVVMHGTTREVNGLLPRQFISNPELLTPEMINEIYNEPDLINQLESVLILHQPKIMSSVIERIEYIKRPLIYLPEIRDVTISGIVKEKSTGLPASNVQVFAAVLFRDFQIHSIKTGEDGRFIFSLNYLNGMHDLYLYAEAKDGRELELLINSDFSVEYPAFSNEFQPPDTSYKKLIEELWINQQVSQYFSGESQKIDSTASKLPFIFGENMVIIKPDDYVSLNTMKEVFEEIIPFVRLRETEGNYEFNIFDKETGMYFKDPLLLLDHIPLSNPGEIIKIHPSQIESIGVITGIYVIGNNTFNGVISINTKAGDFAGINFPGSSVFVEYQTITPESEPIFPKHTGSTGDENIPDFRSLLYWDPDVELSTQNIPFKFSASDHCSAYDIIVKGYTRSGKFCYGKTSFRVKNNVK